MHLGLVTIYLGTIMYVRLNINNFWLIIDIFGILVFNKDLKLSTPHDFEMESHK